MSAHWARLTTADRADARRREQVADRVGRHGRHRSEHPDGEPAERRADHDRGPVRRLEPPVGDEQVLRRHERLQERAAGRVEGDLGPGDDHRNDEELGEAQPAERERDRDGQDRREPGQVHRDHHRPLAAELHPRAERDRHDRARRQPGRGQRRHLSRPGVQDPDRDQAERAEPQAGAVRADRVRRPQPPEPPPQRPPSHELYPTPGRRADQTTAPPATEVRLKLFTGGAATVTGARRRASVLSRPRRSPRAAHSSG